ncbi:uncharacterized protein BP5553_09541 [Venustampulla echinocandica]|uniref:Rhodopsin domain-containing protein n=1 Tax=Venustampulla echinocandica TaxID=2656787 RepID=A0A370TBA2_9HELO|nr:uncharacterized protein BP5553_09541 [Venustampulla echinocandica]RDL31332.1 hypothetical protein BP5553_09541 [Venustampulla echinocandica]
MENSTQPKIIGSLPPPPGVVPNFIDPPDQTTSLVIVHAICLFLVTCCVAMRLYTRQFITGKYGWDDYFCLQAFALTIAFSTCQITADARGFSRHLWDIPRMELARAMKPFIVGVFVYNLLLGSIKLSCLFFYTNIFSRGSKTLLAVKFGIVFVAGAYLGIFFSAVFECHPLQRMWDHRIPGHCFDAKPFAYAGSVINVITDLFVLTVPIPAIMKLPLGLAHKLRVIGVFSLGLFACIVSFVRIAMLVYNYRSKDFTWNSSRVGTWSILEADVGLICSCLFVLPACLKHHGISVGVTSIISHLLPSSFTREAGTASPSSSVQPAQNSWWSNNGNRSDDLHLCESTEYKPEYHPGTRPSTRPSLSQSSRLS